MCACKIRAKKKTKKHLPGRSNRHIETTKRQIQSRSCRLARLRVPLLPMPIHSVWLQFSNCCSSALRLRKITQLFHSLPQPLSFKGKVLKSIAWEELLVASPLHECWQVLSHVFIGVMQCKICTVSFLIQFITVVKCRHAWYEVGF